MSIIITEPKRERGAESKDEEVLERRGFRAGVDLHLGAIDMTNVNRKRERDNQKSPKQFKYNRYIEKRVRMHGKCMNM